MDDIHEQILKRLDVKDAIRCKCVCKSWKSIISTPYFIKTHLHHACNNDHNNKTIRHRRIAMSGVNMPNSFMSTFGFKLIGSSNGLVCIKRTQFLVSNQLLVANPCTREVTKLQIPGRPNTVSSSCWGFGYDSSTNDYKIIRGVSYRGPVHQVSFRVFSLKSNVWRTVGPKLEYHFISDDVGRLCNGALYWLMKDAENKKVVILSFDLSKEEIKEICQPDDDIYKSCMDDDISFSFGVIKEGLCLYESQSSPSSKKWVMKNENEWKLMTRDMGECDDVIHYLTPMEDYVPQKSFLSHEDRVCSPKSEAYIDSPLFVQSLVSPHDNAIVNEKPPKRKRPTLEEDNPQGVLS